MEGRAPLANAAADYYGQNDARPNIGKAVVLMIPIIAVSIYWWRQVLAALLVYLLLVPLAFWCYGRARSVGALKVLVYEGLWYKVPGKRLELRPSGPETSDVILSRKDFVDSRGRLAAAGGLGVSLRKSIECTIDSQIREGPHAAGVAADTDFDRPRFHIHGRQWAYDPAGDEIWTNGARICHWPSVYCFYGYLSTGFSQMIDMASLPEVIGYIIFFEVSNPNFFSGDQRIERVGQAAVNCPAITPQNEGKLFARYGYKRAYGFGNIRTDGSEPDAYIFKGKALEEANMKVLHTYRIMRPEATGSAA